jgi:epoxide hydrolase-like predicted phosphatase
VAAPPPRAVIFDFGGVIWNMGWDAARALETANGLPPGSLHATLYGGDAWSLVERGRGDREAWLAGAHRALEQLAGRALPPLHAEWRALQAPIRENIDLVRALRPRHRTGILSNADATLRERLGNVIGIVDLFDDIVCSAEVGLAKPEPAIYALACARLGLPPGACVFVDDHGPNVVAAADAGLRAILYRVDRGDDLRAQLATAGVAPS